MTFKIFLTTTVLFYFNLANAARVVQADSFLNPTTGATLTMPSTTPTASRVMQFDALGAIQSSSVTTTELGYLSGITATPPPNTRLISTTAPLSGGGNLTADRTLSISQANTTTDGYLSSVDWNTFNNKQPAGNYITALTGDVTASGPGSVAATIANLAVTNAKIANSTIDLTAKVTGILPIANGGTNSSAALNNNRVMQSSGGAIVEAAAITANRALASDANGIPVHSAVTDTELGYVSGVTSAIQTQLNGKQASGNYITALTGDATASGPGSVALTLATVNGDVGSFGSSTSIPTFTVNAKGLITAASGNAVIAPAGTLTGTTLNSTVVNSSLTSVGTIATGVWNGTTIAIANGGTNSTTALNNNRVMRSSGGAIVEAAAITANRALASDANGIPVHTAVTDTELGYVSGVTSAIQTQLNGKQATGNYITDLTGDVTASGPGSVAATLATVNGDVGSFGSSTSIPTFTVNAKGLITAASGNAVVAPAGTLTGTALASNVVTSSLTSVGTIATGVWNGTTIAIANGGTGQTTANAAFNALAPSQSTHSGKFLTTDGTNTSWATVGGSSPLTTKGDIFTYDTANARLPVGTNGQVLTADSAETTGLKWAAAPAATLSRSTKTANYTLTNSDDVIYLDGEFTITLHAASTATSKVYRFANKGTGIVTFTPDGADTIQGEVTQTLMPGVDITIIPDGTSNWNIF